MPNLAYSSLPAASREAARPMQAVVYAISRWTNASRARRRHLDNGNGQPLCGEKPTRAHFGWQSDQGEVTCPKCQRLMAKQAANPECPFLLSDAEALKAEAEVGAFLARSWVLIDRAASIHATDPSVLQVRAGRQFEEEGGLE